MSSPEETTPTLRCPHCGNRTPHDYLHDENVTWVTDSVDGHVHRVEHRRWALLKCQTCAEVSLYGDRINQNAPPGPSPMKKVRVHDLALEWPEVKLPESVPPKVKGAYEEAMQVKQHSANAFANQIRKSLEAVCEDLDANGDNLHNMLGNLEARGLLPSKLGDMTDLIRMVGNAGSHADRFDVDERFVEPMDDFFRTAVRYIYELPSQIEKVQEEYERAEESTSDAAPADQPKEEDT